MENISFHITGKAPLLMHADRGVNTLDDDTKELKKFTKKRTKTDDDTNTIARLEWALGMYFDDTIGPYIPSDVVLATLREGAKSMKKAKDIVKAVQIIEDKLPLQYTGPRTHAKMWDAKFYLIRTVKNQQNRIMRCRPKFDEWSIDVSMVYDEEIIDRDIVVQAMEYAGQYCGFCDFRPRFGRFEIEVTN